MDLEIRLSALNAEMLRAHVAGEMGDIYNAEQVEKSVDALTLAVTEKGQPFGQVRPRIERDPVSRTISVIYVVEQGPRLYIERINIAGNRVTQDYVMRREFRVAEGDAYNKAMVDQAKQRLMKLGHFKDVKIEKEKGSTPDHVVLNATVEEQSTGELGFAAGYSSNEGVIGEISYTERNFLGTGQYLQVKLSGGFVSSAFNVSWTEPHFLDHNMSFGVDALSKKLGFYSSLRLRGGRICGFEDRGQSAAGPSSNGQFFSVRQLHPSSG